MNCDNNIASRFLRIRYLLICIIFIISQTKAQNNFDARINHNVSLELNNKVLIGAGSTNEEFNNFFNVMDSTTKPIIKMTFVNAIGPYYIWAKNQDKILKRYKKNGYDLMLQIGLKMSDNHNSPLDQAIANGDYDDSLKSFCNYLKELNVPVFIRIGVEVNVRKYKFSPVYFKEAYIRITKFLRYYNINAATVWCTIPSNVNFTMGLYPGDEYVDWWGIDLFNNSDFSDVRVSQFLDSAKSHNKPIMIGESTPRTIDINEDKNAWSEWYLQYFSFIESNPEIKAFCYINRNWSEFPKWANWGNARLENNKTVADKFIAQLQSSLYYYCHQKK